MRRTKLQRDLHRRLIEEGLVRGVPPRQIVRALVRTLGITLRQARYDLAQVQAAWQREDDELRQNRWTLRELAIAAERREREYRAAIEAGDARRAARAENDRCKLLGLYHSHRRGAPHLPMSERQAGIAKILADLDRLYADAPRNAD